MRIALLAVLLCAASSAQTFPEPPPLLRVVRTPVADPAAFAQRNGAGALAAIAMSAVTGPVEWWRVEAHASFAGIEQADRTLRPMGMAAGYMGESLAGTPALPAISWVAVYRPWLSFRPSEASQMLPKARYFQALVFRVSPEAEQDFVEAIRARKISLDGLNLDRPEMAYQVISGAQTSTYIFLAPLVSLASFDDVLTRVPQYARGPAKVASAGNLSHENLIFRVEPAVSAVPNEFAEQDPEFWRSGGQR